MTAAAQDFYYLSKIMSVKQSFSSSSYSTSSSVASLSTIAMKSSTSSDSTSCPSLLQSSGDIGRKMATSRCANQENDSSGRSFLSVRKNDSLMRSRVNMVERLNTQGLKLRLLFSRIDGICILQQHYITRKYKFFSSLSLHKKRVYGRMKVVFLNLIAVLCTSFFNCLRDRRDAFIERMLCVSTRH